MARLLLHVGCQKTATTTFQNGLFYKLYKEGFINYLGKADFVDDVEVKNRHLAIKAFLKGNCNIDTHNIKLDENKLNIYSDEASPGLTEDERAICFRQFFSKQAKKTEVLIVLRNQVDMIYSLYVHMYPKFKEKNEFSDIDIFLKHIIDNKKVNYRGFYLYDFIKSYEKVYGKENMKILIYEDFISHRLAFYRCLSEILGVEVELIDKVLRSEHFFKKRKTINGQYAKTHDLKKPWIRIGMIKKAIQRNRLLDNIYRNTLRISLSNRFANRLVKKLSDSKSEEVLIPKLTDVHIALIREEFRDSNIRLSEEYSIELEKMEHYGYISF